DDAQSQDDPRRSARNRSRSSHGAAQGQPVARGQRARRAGRRAEHARSFPRQSHLGPMQYIAPDALERARRIRLMLFDVDGVLTDGQLWYGPMGVEVKAFHGFDGHGLKMLAESGV